MGGGNVHATNNMKDYVYFTATKDSFLKVNHAIIMCFKEKQCCCKNPFCLVEANRAIVIYLRNGEWTHAF